MTELIPQSYLNEACFLSLNVDAKKYSMVLKLAQEDLEDVLGKEFYDEIVDQYEAETLTTDNDTIYEDYIKDFLAWQTYYHHLKFANVDVTPTGIREFTDENSTLASDVKMFSLDSTKYPLYTSRCKKEMSFGISAIGKTKDALIKVNKALDTNE